MKKLFLFKLTVVVFFLVFLSCNEKDDTNLPSSSRNVKYEITGNFTGHLTIIYNDNVSGNTTLNVTNLPWTKEITYPGNVAGIGISGISLLPQPGVSGQTASIKIYSGGSEVKSQTVTANANGAISFPGLTYLFP